MRYDEARDEIRSGDLLAWSHRGWGSWYDFQIQAVRIFTQSEYSHVGIAWVIAGRVFVLEAVGGGVRIMPLSALLPCYWLRLGATWTPAAEAAALGEVGKPYSKLQAIAAFLGRLRAGADGKWQCAEYGWWVLQKLGIDLGETYTPARMVLAAQERGAPLMYLQEAAP